MTESAFTPAAPTASLWEDFVDIFVSPSAVFRRRISSGFGVPLLIIVALFAAMVYGTKSLTQPAIDGDMSRQIAKAQKSHPEMTSDRIDQQRAMGEKVGPIFVIIAIPIIIMLTGVVLWLVGKIFESTQTASAALMVATYAFIPRLLSFVSSTVIALLSSPERLNGMNRLTLGPGALLDPDKASPVLVALLTRVELFTLWETALLAIGLQVTGKVSKGNSYLAAALVWFIGALPGLIGALRQ